MKAKICALITGSSRGIGKALKEALEERGDTVVACVRSEVGDIRNLDTVRKIADIGVSAGVNVLVNCAGVYSNKWIIDETPEKIKEIVEVNLIAPVQLTCALWSHLVSNHGTVININSIAGRVFDSGEIAYRVSKIGLTGFSMALCSDGKRDGVRVIDIPFDGVNTDMLKDRPPLKFAFQRPGAAAELVLQILDSTESHSTRNQLLSGEIIDNHNGGAGDGYR